MVPASDNIGLLLPGAEAAAVAAGAGFLDGDHRSLNGGVAFQSWLSGGSFTDFDASRLSVDADNDNGSLPDCSKLDCLSDDSVRKSLADQSDDDASVKDSSNHSLKGSINDSLDRSIFDTVSSKQKSDLNQSFVSQQLDERSTSESDLNDVAVYDFKSATLRSKDDLSAEQARREWGLPVGGGGAGRGLPSHWFSDGRGLRRSGGGGGVELKNSLEEMVRANYQHRLNQTLVPSESPSINEDSVAFTLIYCSVFLVTLLYIVFKVTLRWKRQRDIEMSATATAGGYDGTNIPLNHTATSLCNHAACQRSHTPGGGGGRRSSARDAILPYSGLGAIWIPEIVSLHNNSGGVASNSCSFTTMQPAAAAVHHTGVCNNSCDNCRRLTVPPPSYTKLFLDDCPPEYNDDIVVKGSAIAAAAVVSPVAADEGSSNGVTSSLPPAPPLTGATESASEIDDFKAAAVTQSNSRIPEQTDSNNSLIQFDCDSKPNNPSAPSSSST